MYVRKPPFDPTIWWIFQKGRFQGGIPYIYIKHCGECAHQTSAQNSRISLLSHIQPSSTRCSVWYKHAIYDVSQTWSNPQEFGLASSDFQFWRSKFFCIYCLPILYTCQLKTSILQMFFPLERPIQAYFMPIHRGWELRKNAWCPVSWFLQPIHWFTTRG